MTLLFILSLLPVGSVALATKVFISRYDHWNG